MLFRNDVAQVSLAARLRFGQHRAGLGIQQGHSRSRGPRLDQHVRILNRRGPGQGIAIAMESLDHVHVLTVEISAELIKPRVAVEAPSRSEEHTSELQSLAYLVCRLLLEKKKKK